jgi:hypothetical protein
MKDIGARQKPGNPIVANLLPINPKAYARLLSTAPALAKQKDTAS